MKNSEEAIEKVLAGLRDADAPHGMERRILDGLEERAAVRSRSGWRGFLPVWLVAPARPVAVGALVGGVALAGVLAVVLPIPAIRRLGHAPVQSKRTVAPAGLPALAASQGGLKSAEHASMRSGVGSVGERGGERKEKTTAIRAAVVPDGDAVALEEMHATSFPAPPMPLTDQERLLLRLVHKDNPVELAMLESMLDSKLRALQESEDKAEFQRFFGQSMKQPVPEQTVTEQVAPPPSTTEQVVPEQSTIEQIVPAPPEKEQEAPEQRAPEQQAPPQAAPEKFVPDQSTTQQATPRAMRTGENQ